MGDRASSRLGGVVEAKKTWWQRPFGACREMGDGVSV
jgi:hypothetical protein